MARILVIEDDELVRATVKRMLEDGGYESRSQWMEATGYSSSLERRSIW